MHDRELIRFHGKVISAAEKGFRASCSEPFVHHLYERYRKEGSPSVEAWLSKTLAEYYLYVGKPPEWVESEPSWPFHNDRPMVFVTQYSLPENKMTREHVTWDTVLYVFAAREKCADGYTMVYRVVAQNTGVDGEGE